MNVMINRPGFQSEVSEKMREAMLHELTCGDLSHMHGAAFTYWDADTSVIDLATTDSVDTTDTANPPIIPTTKRRSQMSKLELRELQPLTKNQASVIYFGWGIWFGALLAVWGNL